MVEHGIIVRAAKFADVPAIRTLHQRSLERLGQGHYERRTLALAIHSGTFQPELLRGDRYKAAVLDNRIVGSGGWLDGGPAAPVDLSPRSPGRGRDGGAAVIRAVYVDPDHARNGIGTALMAAIEADARAAGKTRSELLATRMAVRFFSRLGYEMGGPLALSLGDGHLVDVFAMAKGLVAPPAWLSAQLAALAPARAG